jgi:hypothetical protein
MAKLYELTGQYQQLEKWLETAEEQDPVSGETITLADAMATIKTDIEDKVEQVGRMLLNMDAEGEGLTAEIQRLNARADSLRKRRDGLKNYLQTEMLTLGIDKVKRQLFTVSLRNNPPSVNVVNPDAIPEQFRRIIPESWTPDKLTILKNFKETGEIPDGCEVVTGKKSLVIR